MKTTIIVYRACSNAWRWTMINARNGRIIGASTEGYCTRKACLRNISRVIGPDIVIKGRNRENRYSRTVELGQRQWS